MNYTSNAYVGVNIIDGTGNDCQFDMTIVIKNGKIQAIGKSKELEIPNDAKIIDSKGQ